MTRVMGIVTKRLIAKVNYLTGEDFPVALAYSKVADRKFNGGDDLCLEVTIGEMLSLLGSQVTANEINDSMGRLNRANVIIVETFFSRDAQNGHSFIVNPQQFV